MIRAGNTIQSTGLFVLVVLAVVPAVACGDGSRARDDERRALEQRREQLVIQFASVQNEIRAVQARALDDPMIAGLQARFYDVLRARIIKLEPQGEEWLDRATQVGADLERLSGPLLLAPGEKPPPAEDRIAVGRELAELERILRPIQSEALRYPEVATAFAELQDSLATAMVRLDPNAARTLERMQALDGEVQELDRQIAALDD